MFFPWFIHESDKNYTCTHINVCVYARVCACVWHASCVNLKPQQPCLTASCSGRHVEFMSSPFCPQCIVGNARCPYCHSCPLTSVMSRRYGPPPFLHINQGTLTVFVQTNKMWQRKTVSWLVGLFLMRWYKDCRVDEEQSGCEEISDFLTSLH